MGEAIDRIALAAEDGDVVITLGAGNVWQAGDQILTALTRTPTALKIGA
jgi:hypothetical protein